MKQTEAQKIANAIARRMGARPPRVRVRRLRRSGWSGRYIPERGEVLVQYGRERGPSLRKTLLAHELAHWASRVVYCDRNGRARTCSYKGQHNPPFYRVLSEIHGALGTPKHKARTLESRAGYHPPDGWMSDRASSSYRTSGTYPRIPGVHKADRPTMVSEGIGYAIARYGRGASVSDAEVDFLATRILAKMPPTIRDPRAWAVTVTKNWLIGRYRKALAAPRVEARKREREAKREAFATITASHRSELGTLIERLLVRSAGSTTTRNALQYVWYLYGQGMSDAMIAQRMPGTNRDQRYQWKHRALKLIMPRASESLRTFLRKPLSPHGHPLKTLATRRG